MPRHTGLKKQNISIPILDGLKQNVHDWLVPEGALADCQNVELDKQGTAVKRPGYKEFDGSDLGGKTGTNLINENPERMGSRDDEKYVIGDENVFAHVPSLARWVYKDKSFPCLTGKLDVGVEHLDEASGLAVSTGRYEDCAVYNVVATGQSLMCYVRQDYDKENSGFCIDVDFIDLASGQTILFHRITDGTHHPAYPKVIECGGYFIITYWQTVGARVNVMGVSIAATLAGVSGAMGTWPTAYAIDTATATDVLERCYDISCAPYGGGDKLYVAIVDNTATPVIRLSEWDPSDLTPGTGPSATGSQAVAAGETPEALSCSAANITNGAIVFYFLTSAGNPFVQARTFTTSGAAITQAQAQPIDPHVTRNRVAVSCLGLASSYVVAYSYVDDGAGGHGLNCAITTYVYLNSVLGGAHSHTTANIYLAGPLFEKDGFVYHVAMPWHIWSNRVPGFPVGLTEVDDVSYSHFLVQLDATAGGTHRCRMVALNQLGIAINRYGLAGVAPNHIFLGAEHSWDGSVTYSAQRYLVDAARQFDNIASGTKGFTALKYDFTDQTRQGKTELAGLACVGGGVVAHYDGSQFVENNFPWAPIIVNVAPVIGGGAKIAAGDYYYQVVYETYDELGNRLQSAPSLLRGATAGAGVHEAMGVHYIKPTLTGWTDHESYERKEVFVALYRVETSTGVPNFVMRRRIPYNDATQTQVGAYSDTASRGAGAYDANELLYTGGDELANDPPPAGHIVCTYNNRLFVVSDEQPSRVFYSKEYVLGRGIQFSLAFYIDFDDDAGGITGLNAMDNLLVTFKGKRTYVVGGKGPSATGIPPDGFGAPQVISSTVGCSDHRSVVNTPVGTMFRSSKGFMLLNRSLQLQYVGEPIEQHAADYPMVLSAAVIQKRGLVKFLCSNTAAGSKPSSADTFRIFNYDYVNKTWVHDITGWEEQSRTYALYDAVEWDGEHYLISRSGAEVPIYRQTYGVPLYADGPVYGYNYVSRVWWAWLKLGNLQDFKRIWRARVLTQLLYTPSSAILSHGVKIYLRKDYNSAATTYTWTKADCYALGIGINEPEQFEVHVPDQKCQSIQVGFDLYDCTYGAGLRIIALDLEVGLKRGGFKNLPAAQRK